ncbi:hypothetical protein GDO86_003526 [Hymenochirus boettgeri]|uniref:Shisa N-terminal domain-containing protein n=1 Tax=Hymenochirus boettgeri TaxID=247094 RepID=A0A8T2K9U0_9PIPI|nr:hypothetical protein GDO86_003526 [Hymenochirus boettgeri]
MWHPGFDCHTSFCCGNCHQRFCCVDPLQYISQKEQKMCLALSPKAIAGIGLAVLLFFIAVVTVICCFMCSCCYLYQRRHQRATPLRVQEIQMSGIPQQPPYPVQPPYPPYPMQPPYQMDPKLVPQQGGYAPVTAFPPSGPSPPYPMYSAAPQIYNSNGPPPYGAAVDSTQPGM